MADGITWDDEAQPASGIVWDNAPPPDPDTATEGRPFSELDLAMVPPDEGQAEVSFGQPPALDDNRLGLIFEASLRKAPDRQAGVLELARQYRQAGVDLPADVADAHFDRLKSTFEASRFDPAKWRAEHPELASVVLERPELGAVVMKDEPLSIFSRALNKGLDILGGLDEAMQPFMLPGEDSPEEKAQRAANRDASRVESRHGAKLQDAAALEVQASPFRTFRIPAARYSEAGRQMDIAKLQFELMTRRGLGADTFELEKRLEDARLAATPRDYNEGELERVLGDVAQGAASTVAVLEDAGPLGGLAAGVAGAGAWLLTRSPAAARTAATRGASLGFKSGAALGAFRLESGALYGELSEATTDAGEKLSNAEATGGAILYGTMAAGLEMASLDALLKAAGPAGAILRKGTTKAGMAALMKDASFRAIAANAGKAWLKAGAAEGGTEALQSALEDFVTWATRSVSAEETQAGPVVDVEKALRSGEMGFAGGVGMGSVGVAINLTTEALAHDRALASGAQVAALAQLAESDSPTVRAAPEAVAKLVEAHAAKSGMAPTHLYVDAKAFTTLFQDEKVDPLEAAAELLGEEGPRLLQEAVATGGKLEVPVAQYVERWGAKQVASRLAEDTTADPVSLTTRQMREQREEVEQKAQVLAKQYEAEAKAEDTATETTTPEAETEKQRLKREDTAAEKRLGKLLVEQLVATGKHTKDEARTLAAIWRARQRTAVERVGGSAREYFEQVELSVSKGDPSATAAAAQGTLRQENDQGAPSLQVDLDQELQPVALSPEGLTAKLGGPPTRAALLAYIRDSITPAGPDGKRAAVSVPTATPGIAISVSPGGLKKAAKAAGTLASKLALSDLKQVLASSVLVDEAPDNDGRRNIHAYSTFLAPVDIEGRIHVARISARKLAEGRNFYTLHTIEIQGEGKESAPGGTPGEGVAEATPVGRPTPGAPLKLRTLVDGVKAADQKTDLKDKLLHETPGGSPRGYLQHGWDGLRRRFKVGLNPNADSSTFLHESGHVFLEMFGDMAEKADAPEQVKKDWAATLQWLGVDSRQGIKREHHEKWARGFEAYLFEGKAPSAKLEAAFTRFSLWLRQVYKSLASLNVELSDDIRGVFDRLLATDAEIARTKRAMGLQPLFRSPEDAGMAPEQWQAYLDDQAQATANATRQAELRAMKDRLRETEKWWKDEEAKHAEQAERDYEELPARKAQLLLRGRPADGVVVSPVRLDRAAVEAAVGEEAAKRFTRVKKGGTHPDEIADLLGFPTGALMLQAIVALPAKETWSKDTARTRMLEQHPDVLQEREKLRELAAKGLHGDFTARWLLKEWAALRKKAGTSGVAPIESIKRAAALIVERRAVGKLNAGGTLASERSAAERAAKAAAKGDFAQAAILKQQQLLNMYLHREFTEARDQREAFLELAKELGKDKVRARLGKGGPIYRDGVDLLLETFALKEPSPREQGLPRIGEVVAAMQADGATVMFDQDLVDRLLAQKEDYRELTVAEIREVHAALKNIRGAARAKSTVLVDGKRQDKEEVIASIVEEAERLPAIDIASSVSAESLGQRLESAWNSFDGASTKPELMVLEMLGGGSLKSTSFRAIVKPLQDAKAREADLLNGVLKPLLQTFEKMPSKVRARLNEKVDGRALFPAHIDWPPPPSRRFELLMLVLNVGTESNTQRLTEGRGITREQVLAAANQVLTKQEMDFAQSVFDTFEALKPLAFDLEERDSGLRPRALEATSIVTRHGTYRGGYFPAIYDRRVSVAGERQAAQSLADLLDPSFVRPGTSRGHLKARVENFTGVLSLEPDNIPQHLFKVAHDIAYREAVKSVGGLILDGRIQEALKRRIGDGRAKQFRDWVQDVGQMRGASALERSGVMGTFHRKLRGNLVYSVLGHSIPNGLEDLVTGLAGSVAGGGLKARHLAAGLSEFITSPKRSATDAEAKSGELRARRGHLQRELGQQMRKLTASGPLARGPLAWVRDHAFDLAEVVDLVTTTSVWSGFYRQALAEGRPDADAVTFADAKLRRLFPSHSAVDMSGLARDKGFIGTSLVFFSFQSTFYNVIRSTLARREFSRALGFYLAVAWLGPLVRGHGPEEDEDWSAWMMRKSLTGALYLAPGGGDVGNAIEAKLLGRRANPRSSSIYAPFVALGEALWNLPKDEVAAEKKVKDLLRPLGQLSGVPVVYPMKSLGYLAGVASGDIQPEDPLDFLEGLIYGQRVVR